MDRLGFRPAFNMVKRRWVAHAQTTLKYKPGKGRSNHLSRTKGVSNKACGTRLYGITIACTAEVDLRFLEVGALTSSPLWFYCRNYAHLNRLLTGTLER